MTAALSSLKGWWQARREVRSAALPVRDRVDLSSARPVRLLAFDQALVVVVGVLDRKSVV